VFDGIAATTTHADHLDLGAFVKFVDHFDGHVSLLMGCVVLPVDEEFGPVELQLSIILIAPPENIELQISN
jgi:hypothetical protein